MLGCLKSGHYFLEYWLGCDEYIVLSLPKGTSASNLSFLAQLWLNRALKYNTPILEYATPFCLALLITKTFYFS